MMNIISTGTFSAIVAAATISVMAQPPSQQPTTPPPPPTATQAPPPSATTSSMDKRVTVTGCLKPAPAATDAASAPTGTAGTTGSAATGATDAATAKFVLTDAVMSPATETPQNASADASAQTYRLVANVTALAPHVGKKLELTGTIVDPSSSASSSAADQTSPESGPTLRVESGKVLAASCQP